jgi:esterase/lipase superfamily enzyme
MTRGIAGRVARWRVPASGFAASRLPRCRDTATAAACVSFRLNVDRRPRSSNAKHLSSHGPYCYSYVDVRLQVPRLAGSLRVATTGEMPWTQRARGATVPTREYG